MEQIRLTRDLRRPELAEAAEADLLGLDVGELEAGVASGEYLAVDIEGQATAVLEIRPIRLGRRALSVVALGGAGMDQWLSRFVAFLDWLARDQGCTQVLAVGRPGWRKALRAHGFQEGMTLMTMRVSV